MRQPREGQLGDLAAHVEIDDDRMVAVAGRSDELPVGRIEEEVVEGCFNSVRRMGKAPVSEAMASSMPFS